MLEVLNDCEREVVLAHERAHLTGRHFLFLLTSRLAAAVCPLLIPVATAVAHCVERWADETAAARTGHRRVAAAAIGKAALARQQYGRLATAQWALHAATGSVPRRVAALLMPPQRSRPWLPLVIATVLAAACLAALVPAEHVHEILKAARLSLR
jgi:beta-lactamase regulating signal transducer with metallopeptidase domain